MCEQSKQPQELALNNIHFIRILWCDNGGAIRAKAVHKDNLSSYFQHGVGISAAQQAVPITVDAPAPGSGLGPVGEVRLVPDWKTLVALPYAPGHAQVMGKMMLDQHPWACCPRAALQRVLTKAAKQGLYFQTAFENEFYLLRPGQDESLVPADQNAFAMTQAMDQHHEVIDAIVAALRAQGISIEQYYPESGHGQQEISMRHQDPFTAADQQIIFRQTVKAVARQHQLLASFVPKLFADQAGNGCHLHLSLWKKSQNILADPSDSGELSLTGQQFVAGLLQHLPALMAVTTPSPNSYRRLQPSTWSGAFTCWGYDNREAAIRVPTQPVAPSPTQLEFKTLDATANPYLALTVILAAGLDGVERQLSPPQPLAVDPASLNEAEREQQMITRLPQSLEQAIQHFEQDALLQDVLGSSLTQAFLAVRRAEWNAMKDWDLATEGRFLLECY